MKPLHGIRVLDFTHILAGPYCTMILADLGADVIKVEKPGGGDDSRSYGPHLNGRSMYFSSINRGKRSLTLDLGTPEGIRLALDLAMKSDVVAENFRPGTMERLGLGYEDLKGLNPRLVYAGASGFGRTGPWAGKPAYDLQIQAMCGLMSITGPQGGPPTKVGPSIIDMTTGTMLAMGVVTALYSREKTGVGQAVDVGMLDVGVAMLENAVMRRAVTGETPVMEGNRHPSITPFDTFRAGDGKLFTLAVAGDRVWRLFCKTVARDDLVADPRFRDNVSRTRHHPGLKQILEDEVFCKNGAAEWVAALDAAGVPASLICGVDALSENPQVEAREMLVELGDPSRDGCTVAGNPLKFSGTPAAVDRPAPDLGEHTDEILRELAGLSSGEIGRLREKGVL